MILGLTPEIQARVEKEESVYHVRGANCRRRYVNCYAGRKICTGDSRAEMRSPTSGLLSWISRTEREIIVRKSYELQWVSLITTSVRTCARL